MAEPVRVLHVLAGLNRAGAETMIMNLYRNIDRDKVQFDFAVCSVDKNGYAGEILSLGGRIYQLPRLGPKTLFSFRRDWAAFFREHPEHKIIHGHLRSSASIYLGIARKFGRVTVAHSHSTSSGSGLAAFVKNVLQRGIRKKADYMIACSAEAGLWLYGRKAVESSRYFILTNAIDAQTFVYNDETRRRIRQELSLGDSFVVGHIGSFIPVKNHAFLVDVFEEILKEDAGAVLLLVGDGELRPLIEETARERGFGKSVITLGIRDDIPDLLQAFDVLLMPSKWEGIPLVAIEAQASGLRCVLSDTISKEAKISDLASFYPLKDGPALWAEKVLRFSKGYKRENMLDVIRTARYDIRETAGLMQEFYLRKSGCSDE